MADVRLVFVRENAQEAEALADMFDAAGLSIGDCREPLDSSAVVVVVWSHAALQSRAFAGAAEAALNSGKAVIARLSGPPWGNAAFGGAPVVDLWRWEGEDSDDPALDPLFFAVDRRVVRVRADAGHVPALPFEDAEFDEPEAETSPPSGPPRDPWSAPLPTGFSASANAPSAESEMTKSDGPRTIIAQSYLAEADDEPDPAPAIVRPPPTQTPMRAAMARALALILVFSAGVLAAKLGFGAATPVVAEQAAASSYAVAPENAAPPDETFAASPVEEVAFVTPAHAMPARAPPAAVEETPSPWASWSSPAPEFDPANVLPVSLDENIVPTPELTRLLYEPLPDLTDALPDVGM